MTAPSKPVIHVCTGSNVRYRARVRLYGYRHYQLVGPPRKSYEHALVELARAFAGGNYKRGDVLMSADYYDPVQICEIVRT